MRLRISREPEHANTCRKYALFTAIVAGALIGVFLSPMSGTATAQSGDPRARQGSVRIGNPLEHIGKLMYCDRRYAEAGSLALTLISDIEQEDPVDSLFLARALDTLVVARLGLQKEQDPETMALAERALGINERLLGPESPEAASSHIVIGRVLLLRGDTEGAGAEFNRALEIQQKTLGPEHLEIATTLRYCSAALGGRYSTGSNAEKRAAYLERALTICERHLKPGDPRLWRYAETYGWAIGASSMDLREFRETDRRAEQSCTIARDACGSESYPASLCLQSLGAIRYFRGGDYAGAKPCFERALSYLEKRYGPGHDKLWKPTAMLSQVLFYLGEYDRSRQLADRAVEIREQALPADDPRLGQAYTVRGQDLLNLWGDYDRARIDYEKGLPLFEGTPWAVYVPWVRWQLAELAVLEARAGNREKARAHFDQVMPRIEREAHPDSGYMRSLDLVDEAVRIRGYFAEFLIADGDFSEARRQYVLSLALLDKLIGHEHPWVAASTRKLGFLQLALGNTEEAKELFLDAARIGEQFYGRESNDLALSLVGLAAAEAMLGDGEAALQLALEAEDIGRNHVRLVIDGMAEREGLRYLAMRAKALDVALSLIATSADYTAKREAWDALVRSRGLILDEIASRLRAVRLAGDPEVADLVGELAVARQRLANLTVRGPGKMDADLYRDLLLEARDMKEAGEIALAQKSSEFRLAQAERGIGLDEALAALPAKAALVSYARYEQHRWDAAAAGARAPPARDSSGNRKRTWYESIPSYLAFVQSPNDPNPVVVPLGDAREIDSLVVAWKRTTIKPSSASSAASAELDYRQAGETLRQKIWDPVTSHVGNAERVFIVPEGTINLVSFASLPTHDHTYLIETGPEIQYLSAERDLARFGANSPGGAGLLAVGGPAFDEKSLFAAYADPQGSQSETSEVLLAAAYLPSGRRSACGDFQTLRFDPLPGAAEEVDEVAALWASQDAAQVVKLVAGEASEASLKQSAQDKRVIHLATHGFFLGADCRSALEATRGIGMAVSADPPPPTTVGDNPLLLSGLALAGANQRESASPDEEDGVLTAEEIASLDLRGVEWAVLSACETGVGEVQAGEGVFGLRRAFQVAGARTVIMSLWSVEDEATREWMNQLYEARLVDRLDTAESVRQASLRTLNQRRAKGESTHPFYWGAFVAAGDWR